MNKHADAKANQIFYHTLPCRATFLVVFDEDFFARQHLQAQLGSPQPLAEPALAAKFAGHPSNTPRFMQLHSQITLLTMLSPECAL